CLPALERAFPDRRFYVETQLGQELFFGVVNPDESAYDLTVFIVFPCAFPKAAYSNIVFVSKCIKIRARTALFSHTTP
ncbi:MAG: hypothetical protein J6Z44_04100, partial [Bacteroidales bacterium]|nr:hypothetical protein [Bacteroidales bacterium]